MITYICTKCYSDFQITVEEYNEHRLKCPHCQSKWVERKPIKLDHEINWMDIFMMWEAW